MSGWYRSQMTQTCDHFGIPTDVPFGELDEDSRDIMLNGSGGEVINFEFNSEKGSSYTMSRPWEGVFSRLARTYKDTSSERTRSRLSSFMTDEACSTCRGDKLNDAVSKVTVGGVNLPGISSCSVLEALAVVQNWRLGGLDDTWDNLDRDAPDSVIVQSTERLDERSMYLSLIHIS